MAFADDLLEQAYLLANLPGEKQASFRRAVSTAYYALFHLLIDEAVGNWNVERQRGTLARIFDHAKMKKVCDDHVKQFYSASRPPEGERLKDVAHTFAIRQEKRLIADYDNSYQWTRTNAVGQIDLASAAFDDWRAIRATDDAQDLLLTMFLPKPPRA